MMKARTCAMRIFPPSCLSRQKEHHQKLIESVAESDEALMEKFFEGEELTVEEINAAIRKATIDCTMNPVLCGTSYRNKGVQPLLDAVVEYMPSPLDIPAIKGVDVDDPEKELERHPSDDEPFSALAFKIIDRPVRGQAGFLPRVFRRAGKRQRPLAITPASASASA